MKREKCRGEKGDYSCLNRSRGGIEPLLRSDIMSNTIFFVLFQSLLDEFMLRPAYSYTYKFNFLIVKLTGYNTLFTV